MCAVLPQVLAVLGIVCVLVGTICMGLAVIRVPEWLSDPFFQRGHREVIEVGRDYNEMGWEKFPPEVQKQKMADAEKKYREEMVSLDREITEAWHKDRSAMVNLTLWGLGFVLLGSVCQGVAIVLAVP
jgi:hypothetical protein